MNNYYPLRLSGIAKETIWGGDRIKSRFGADCSDKTGELWVLSARQKEDCTILNGVHKGMTLTEYTKSFMPEYVPFPLLIKFIDANDRLSVQVHPDDETAALIGGDAAGKTEMWHIIAAEPDATIVYGIKNGASVDDLKKAVDDGCVEDLLNYVPVKAGDTFFIPAGLVHAIGKGILLAEVQQNSDTTYRFYDYGRLDANGNPRELHIEKALTATRLMTDEEISSVRFSSARKDEDESVLADCKYFKVIRKKISGKHELKAGDSTFISMVCLSGKAVLSWSDARETVLPGDSFFVPHDTDRLEITGNADLLISFPKNTN